ncbi:glycosyltransferase [Parapedobacter sp.]
MKLLLIGDGNSSHLIKWASSLAREGVDTYIWSLTEANHNTYEKLGIPHYHANLSHSRTKTLEKLKYLTAISNLKSCVRRVKPDILHAHYASSYGLLGSRTGFHPFIISVWGADVYDFPMKNPFFKRLLVGNLRAADRVLSTSHVMADETRKYTNKEITVTPFGVDLSVFNGDIYDSPSVTKEIFTVGTIKSLEDKYGINYLIESFSIFRKRYPSGRFKLLIVGKGSKEAELKKLAKDLNIYRDCEFINAVPHDEVPNYYSTIDVAVFPSILDSESFGVAAVEASAMSKPVIVSSVGGLNEVVVDKVTGIKVPPKDSSALADAMEYLYLNADIRSSMGMAGRARVREFYHWPDNVRQMIGIYKETINDDKS